MKKYTTTTGALFNLFTAINKTGIMDMAFSKRGNLSLFRNMSKFESELKEYIEQRNKLILDCKDENKDTIDAGDTNWDRFTKELEELNSVEVETEINTISVDDLPDGLTPSFIGVLNFMIEEDK